MKKILVLSMGALLSISITATAETLRVGGIQITGGGLMLVGTTSTTTGENNQPLATVGWVLIAFGSLINGGHIANAAEVDHSGKEVWDSVIREASVIARSPRLAKPDTPIANAAVKVNIPAQDLAQMVLDIDHEVKLAESSGTNRSAADLESKIFPRGFDSDDQKRAFENMVALASMR